jgi:hypothetical protein
MSNYLAIATTTAALQQVLLTPVSNAVGSAVVGFNRPDAASSTTPLVNIFLSPITPVCLHGAATDRWYNGRRQRSICTICLRFMATMRSWNRSGYWAR